MTGQNSAISHVLDRHAEDAAFLWLQRDEAVTDPHYDLNDLAELDNRLAAHLDGLNVAHDAGWAAARTGLAYGEPGEVFVAGWLAINDSDGRKVDQIISAAAQLEIPYRPFAAALAWHPPEHIEQWKVAFSRSRSSGYKLLAVTADALARSNPTDLELQGFANDQDTRVLARTLRAIGELGRSSLTPLLREHLENKSPSARFWAHWSSVLVGDRSCLNNLRNYVHFDSEYSWEAMQILFRVLPLTESEAYLRSIGQTPELRRKVIQAFGITGNVSYIPTLVGQMAVPEYARVAGEAFSMITGVDLAYEDLDQDQPDDFTSGPTESPEDDDVELDKDAFLPWPNPTLIQSWWAKNAGRFQPTTRYLCGQAISEQHCQEVLRNGYQRQRIAAAYELALSRPKSTLFEWRAPGHQQKLMLGQ